PRLRCFRLWLAGSEEATQSGSKHAETQTSPFAKILIVEAGNPADAACGGAQVVVPERSMHSMSLNHNRIIWHIVVECVIDGRPDFTDQAVVVVRPWSAPAG